jgi:hypothetical protein
MMYCSNGNDRSIGRENTEVSEVATCELRGITDAVPSAIANVVRLQDKDKA